MIPHGAKYLKSMHAGLKALKAKSEKMAGGLEPEMKPIADEFHEGAGKCMDNLKSAHGERYKDADFDADDDEDKPDEKPDDKGEIKGKAEDEEDDGEKSLSETERKSLSDELAKMQQDLEHEARKLRAQGITV
jgi:hypothetical protein